MESNIDGQLYLPYAVHFLPCNIAHTSYDPQSIASGIMYNARIAIPYTVLAFIAIGVPFYVLCLYVSVPCIVFLCFKY